MDYENQKFLSTILLCIVLEGYYINKSDLGTGNIEMHPFNLPKFETT